MPLDWDKIDKDLDGAVARAKKKTNDELAAVAATFTRLNPDDIKKICPTPADVQKLKELMRIVDSATKENTKVKNIADNIKSFGGIIVRLLGKL